MIRYNKTKKRSLLFTSLLSLFAIFLSCQDELPEAAQIEKGKENVTFAVDGGSTAVQLVSNANWKASSSQSWLTVSPASGSKGTHSIMLSATGNGTDGQRNATVTIQVGHNTTVINVIQSQRDVLGLATPSTTVAWMSGSYDMKFSTNISGYEFKTDVDWLQPAGTRALTEKALILNYSENPGYEARTGRITVSKGSLTTTFTLTQGGRGALYFILDGAEVNADVIRYELKLMKNISANGLHLIDVAPWLHLPGTRALPVEETVVLSMDANITNVARSARLVIRDESTGTLLTDTFTLTQKGLENVVRPAFTTYQAGAKGETFGLSVTASGPFELTKPVETEWLTIPEGVQTSGTLSFTVAPNVKGHSRTAVVTMRLQPNGDGSATPVEATLTVTQVAADVADTDRLPKLFNLLEMATVIETESVNLKAFRATVTYDANEPTGWVTNIYANAGKLHFQVDDNSGSIAKRSAVINLSFESGETAAVRINQSGNAQVYMELEEPGTLTSFIDYSHTGRYKELFLKAKAGLNNEDYKTLRRADLSIKGLDMSEVASLLRLPDEAFSGHASLDSIILPPTITEFGNRVFYNCPKLKVVTSQATVPPALSTTNAAETFGGVNEVMQRKLKVPAASVQAYTEHSQWKLATPLSGTGVVWTIEAY